MISNYSTQAFTNAVARYNANPSPNTAVTARDLGLVLGYKTSEVANFLGIPTRTLTNFVRSRNRNTGNIDNIILNLNAYAEAREKTKIIYPEYVDLVAAIALNTSTRKAAALAKVSYNTASRWSRKWKSDCLRSYSAEIINAMNTRYSSTEA